MSDAAKEFAAFLIDHASELTAADLQRGVESLQAYMDELEITAFDGLDISTVAEQNRRDWEGQKEAIDGRTN